MKFILSVFILLATTTVAIAQRECAGQSYVRGLLKNDPSLQAAYDKVEQQIATSTVAFRDTAANETINIPVVIHLLYKTADQNISDAQIKSQIDALNKDFNLQNDDQVNTPAAFKPFAASIKIKFCLAQVDPQGKRTSGINRKYTTMGGFAADDMMKTVAGGGLAPWDSKRYLNIWICNLGGRTVGYATPPGTPADKDGVVIAFDAFGTIGSLRAAFNKGRTATHEIGHWLGLRHVWGDSDCGDDGIDDTPRQRAFNYGCPTFPRVTSCSQTANGDMFMNFMDFTDDACMNMFTAGQKNRMRAMFAANGFRNSFLTSFACDSLLVQGGPIASNTPPVETIATEIPTSKVQVVVYPNPAQSMVTIDCKSANKISGKTLCIYSMVGTMVFSSTVTNEKSTINVAALLPGVYTIKIGEGQNVYTTKLVKL